MSVSDDGLSQAGLIVEPCAVYIVNGLVLIMHELGSALQAGTRSRLGVVVSALSRHARFPTLSCPFPVPSALPSLYITVYYI